MSEARLREAFDVMQPPVVEGVLTALSQLWRVASLLERDVLAAVDTGDRVRLGESVYPPIARGRPATITRVTAELLHVRLDHPVGPFATTDLEVIPLEIRPLYQ